MPAGDETESGTPSRSYEVGTIQRLPWHVPDADTQEKLTQLVRSVTRVVQEQDPEDEMTHLFVAFRTSPPHNLREQAEEKQRKLEAKQVSAIEDSGEVDRIVASLLGLRIDERGEIAATVGTETNRESDATDVATAYSRPIHQTIQAKLQNTGGNRRIAVKSFHVSRHLEVLAEILGMTPRHIAYEAASKHLVPDGRYSAEAFRLISYAVGSAFGRWDVRLSLSSTPMPELPDPFDPLGARSPGMLRLGPLPEGYPLSPNTHGILAQDLDHADDIVRWIRTVLAILYQDCAESIELEACRLLEAKDLYSYLSGPRLFFTAHIQEYSESRRKAPIYWLLQSRRASYGLWLYYHRLDKDTLFKALTLYVNPKIQLELNRLEGMRVEKSSMRGGSGPAVRKLDKQIETQEASLRELYDFRDKLQRVADLGLEPDLDDGVVLNIAPLHELVPWKEAKTYWDDLMAGKYEWSSIGKQLRAKGLVAG